MKTHRSLIAMSAAALVVIGSSVTIGSASSKRALFVGDWESGGTAQWAGCQSQHDGAIRVSSTRVRQGNRRAAMFPEKPVDRTGKIGRGVGEGTVQIK